MLTLKKVKELVEAPVHTKRVPSPKVLLEEGLILMRKEFDHGSHLTVYQSGYVLFSAGKRNTVFHMQTEHGQLLLQRLPCSCKSTYGLYKQKATAPKSRRLK